MNNLRQFVFPRLFSLLLALLLGAGLLLMPPLVEGASRQRPPRRPSRASARAPVSPKAPGSRPSFTLDGTGIQPRPNSLLADPVMNRLRAASQAFLNSPSPANRQQLARFAASHTSHAAGALAYLVLGYKAYVEEKFADAAGLLRSRRKIASPVPDYLDYYLADSLQKLGRHQEALEVLNGFEQKYASSTLAGRATLARAESLIATGQASAAVELLKTSVSALPHPQADLLLARAQASSGDTGAALQAYRQAYYRYPVSAEAEQAGRELQLLESRMRGSVPPVPADLRKERAERLFAARQFHAAQDAYKDLARAASGAGRELALVRAAAAAFRGRRTAVAYAALSKLQPEDPAADAERLYYLAECQRRRSQESEFQATVERLGQRYPASPWQEDALLSAGNYWLLKREESKSESYFRTLSQRFPSGKNAPLAQWRVAWSRYRAGDFDTARKLLEEFVLRYPQNTQVAAALYWLGRLAESGPAANPAVALAYFRTTAERFPQYFYGTLARQKLAERPANRTPAKPRAVPASALPDNVVAVLAAVPVFRPNLNGASPPADLAAHRRKVEALEAAWLLDLAVTELRHVTEDAGHSQYLLLELARLEHDRGNFLSAILYLRQALPNYFAYPVETLDRSYWELLFPLPWWSAVKAEAQRYSLDPYLMAALIRQESAFDPGAVSRARAYGLMQLLPSTARRVARQLGRGGLSNAELFDPETNIELGARYLHDTLQRYEGKLEYALASYNAGPLRVDTWLAQNSYRDVPEFIESIPFTETREYVQAVIRNSAVYRRLYPGR